ncbi:hypothetical protein Fmac_022258 [Flemingia macrophylla]|uniref:Carrier domain-containing protein n=1 Tax=Flemingia macrophylla TaxID=520843 RepID=A0ABD1LZD6_9FABA
MDLEKSIEEQFSKLHPSLPENTRIGIVGAGPSGLSAAYALARLGYKNITVLEKHHTVGGMCESVEIEGKIYDLGGQVLAASSAPVIFHLARETVSALEELDSHKLAIIDPATGEYQDIKVADDYVSIMSLTLEIQEKVKNRGRIGVHAVSDIASDLTPEYLEHRGLKSVPKSVGYGYTASGYGFIQDMPYAYLHEFTRTSMAGKIRRFNDGYTSLWQKIAESLPLKLCCNTEVLAIRRKSDGVTVNAQSLNHVKTFEFDKIIISGSFPFNYGRTSRSLPSTCIECETEVMDASDLEKDLFSKVETNDYYTTVLKIKGLEHLPVGFYYFSEYMENPSTIGNPVAMQRFYADTDIFLFWSYGNYVDVKGSTVTQLLIKTIEAMGGEVENVILQRRFMYFPHVGSQDIKDGFYEKLETKLQGSRNTYYVGGLMAFELTETNSSYAMALICKNFANSNDFPMFPYTKDLFPLQTEYQKKNPKELGELPEVQFPNLPTLNSYLKHWGTHLITQSRTLYTWINEQGTPACQRTYRELYLNSSCIAHKLLTSQKPVIKPGDKVLLVYVPGLDFIDAFFGCLRAKVIPVPILPPDPMQRNGQALIQIENIAKACSTVAILSTVAYHSAVRAGSLKNLFLLTRTNGKSSSRWPNLPWLHTDTWVKNPKSMVLEQLDTQCEPQPGEICFLQFTSGSTSDAKGVMITHGGLIHNVKLMRRRYKSTSRTVLVSWLPQYHDMGLIGGLFTSLVSGGSAILFSPMTFIKKPLLWLETIGKYQATHSAGPNFAFELVIRRLESDKDKLQNLDLSSLVFLMVAAEPVRQKTLKRFIELTSPFGLFEKVIAPGYGLAENCVDVDVGIRIVDPETSEEIQEDGKEGEIWISSPSAGIGYWGREDLSKSTFKNGLNNHPGRIYTRTGDLGRIIDQKLFITGRIKDLIIVAGRNIYSADVEKTVETSSEFLRPGCCAVIGVPEEILSAKVISIPDGSDQVGLVVIAEVRDGKPVIKDVIEKIKTCVVEEHGVSVASVKLIKPRTISKTTSGKIKRFECVKQFTDETLNLVSQSPRPILTKKSLLRSISTRMLREGKTTSQLAPRKRISKNEIIEFLKGLISMKTGIPVNNISVTDNLTSYGIDSIGVVKATQKLSDFLGTQVAAIDVFTASCILELANFSEDLLSKSQPQLSNNPSNIPEDETDSTELIVEVSKSRLSDAGCRIGSSVLLDTVDITDPSLVSIEDEAVIAEGVLIQSHEVKNGILSFHPISIGKCSSSRPYAVIQKGSVIGEGVEVQALQKNAELPVISSKTQHDIIYHFIGIYLVGFLCSLAAVVAYLLYIRFSKQPLSPQHFSFVCICGAFHWIPFTIIAYATMFSEVSSNPITFAISFTSGYLLHGFILIILTTAIIRLLQTSPNQNEFKTWLQCQVTNSCHLRCAKLLSGTEAFCIYLRLLGAKIGKHCSIRAINPVSYPKLMSIGDGVHLGDFSRIITGFHSSSGYIRGKIEVQDNSVIGSQSLILPGSLVQKNVILGALSVVPMNSTLQEGGVYIGSQSQLVVRNPVKNSYDEGVKEMDMVSKKKLGSLVHKNGSQKVTLTRTWYQNFSALFTQPLLQLVFPHMVLGLAIFVPLNCVVYLKRAKKLPIYWSLPLFWVQSGALAALACVIAKWILVGRKKASEEVPIWSQRITLDSTWQAIRTLVGDYFMDMTSGSFWFVAWMKLMGADVDMEHEIYVDSMGALLNPEMVKIERGGCVGRESLLFGHIYEGEGGMVKFGEIKIGEKGFVGSRAVVMPGVQLENDGNLSALSLAMKEEIIRSR